MKNTKKGFTLVEVLIVVVIIAILASLIVPRMLMQTKKAQAAEAFQVVGAIKRAGERNFDMHGTSSLPGNVTSVVSNPFEPTWVENEASWNDLGLTGIDKSKNWGYSYYTSDPTYNFQVDAVDQSLENQLTYIFYADSSPTTWTCYGIFKAIEPTEVDGHVSLKGCAI